MRTGTVILAVGVAMIVAGFAGSAAVQGAPDSAAVAAVKHGGVFAGLLGIGAGIAGALVYIIGRYNVAV